MGWLDNISKAQSGITKLDEVNVKAKVSPKMQSYRDSLVVYNKGKADYERIGKRAENYNKKYGERGGKEVITPKYQDGGSTPGSDTYTRMMNAVGTFGTSAIGDLVDGFSHDAADWLEEYSGGLIPHTTEEMMAANRGSDQNKFKQAQDTANMVTLGVITAGVGKAAVPYISKASKAIINKTKRAPKKTTLLKT